jgi:hypothetical protein
MPELSARPLALEFLYNGVQVGALSLKENGWRQVELDLSQVAMNSSADEVTSALFEIRASHTWQPSATIPESNDDRELSIAVCNVEVFG